MPEDAYNHVSNPLTIAAELASNSRKANARKSDAGAEPSNTAPATYTGALTRLLRTAIDSLYVSCRGTLSVDWNTHLGQLKEAAQSFEASEQAVATVEVGGLVFRVLPTGSRFYKYKIECSEFFIQLSAPDSKRIPLASCQIRSWYLTKVGPREAVTALMRVLVELGEIEGELQITRVDLCADFTADIALDDWPSSHWVSRARRIVAYTMSGIPSGWSIGEGNDIAARLYDKTLEIESSGKQYLKPIWHQQGWEPPQRVYRLEFQYRGRVLKEHAIRTLEELLKKLGPLWRYSSVNWLRLATPSSSDTNQNRWPTHPVWEALSQADWGDVENGTSMPERERKGPSEERMYVQNLGGLTTYMAVKNMPDAWDAMAAWYLDAKAFFRNNDFLSDITFEEYLHDRAARKATMFCLPFSDNQDRSVVRAKLAVMEANKRAWKRTYKVRRDEDT